MNEQLDYAERCGIENMRERIEVAAMIQREANTALALLLAGAGAALAYAAGDSTRQMSIAAFAVSVYLFCLALLLANKCLGLIAYPAIFNEPGKLNRPEYSLEQIRNWELENLQARINEAVQINEQRGELLNRCRVAAAFTPVIAALAYAAAGS